MFQFHALFPAYRFLTYTYSPNQTLLLKLALERENIPYEALNENVNNLFQILGSYNSIMPPVEFYVAPYCIERAQALLKDIPPVGESQPLTDEAIYCPQCGALFPEEGLACHECGFSFEG
jgi:hypothetical protein